MRCLRYALFAACFLAAAFASASRADPPALDECLKTVGDLYDLLEGLDFFGRSSDSCADRTREIEEYESIMANLRALRTGACRPDRIAGGKLSADEIETMLTESEEDAEDIAGDLEGMRVARDRACAAGDAPQTGNRAARKPDRFAFTVCNKDYEEAHVAISHRVAPDSRDFWVEGWWSVAPGTCETIGTFLTGWFYYYAETNDGWWGGDSAICVTYDRFKRVNYHDADYTCDEDELKKFTEVDVEKGEFTANLNP